MFDVRQLPQMTTRQSAVRTALVWLLHVALLWLATRRCIALRANRLHRHARCRFKGKFYGH